MGQEIRVAPPYRRPPAGHTQSPSAIKPIRDSVVYRFPGIDDSAAQELESLPFPRLPFRPDAERSKKPRVARDVQGRVSPPHEALDALDDVSRRMENLARALDCLGFFDDDDGPRAA
jgi:hypothetical protein